MRIEYPHRHERFGAVRIHELTQVIELDSGLDGDPGESVVRGRRVHHVPARAINAVEKRMAIVVPTRNERRKVIDGVLSGIPHDCTIVLVSASEREPIDRYDLECALLEDFCDSTGRRAVAIHQFDPGLGVAVEEAGIGELGESGTIRPGKGEAMIAAMLITETFGLDHVGFVDADNYVPGAVHEYVKSFAAGLHLAPSPYAMVRISWHSKPKVEEGRLVFNRWGRTSQVTNRFLNLVLSTYSGFGTEVIKTGNSGEHGMTMELARRLRFAGGFAVEPYELIDMFAQFGGALASPHPEVNRSLVDVFQVETRNPHFHEDKGKDHIDDMRVQALHALYHSPVCPAPVRREISDFLESESLVEAGGSPPEERIYPAFESVDIERFGQVLGKAESFRRFGPG
jgi:mannosyl-3-phosphoglycerate synthase